MTELGAWVKAMLAHPYFLLSSRLQRRMGGALSAAWKAGAGVRGRRQPCPEQLQHPAPLPPPPSHALLPLRRLRVVQADGVVVGGGDQQVGSAVEGDGVDGRRGAPLLRHGMWK